MARRLTEGVDRDVTGDENQDLNKCVESSDPPPPLHTYTSCDFFSLVGTHTFPLITLYRVSIPLGEMGGLFSFPAYVVLFLLV